VSFTATGTAGTATKYVVTSSGYGPIAGTAVTISAQLTDTYGNPVSTSGLVVTWSKSGSGGSFATAPARPIAAGLATVSFTTGTTAGVAYTVTATDTSSRTGHEHQTSPPSPERRLRSPSTPVTASRPPPARMSLSLLAHRQGRLRQRRLRCECHLRLSAPWRLSHGRSATTNSAGIATVGSWTLGQTAGSNTLTATSAGLTGSPVSFTATGTAGTATQIAINAGNGQSATAAPPSLSLLASSSRTRYGNAVSGVSVTFAIRLRWRLSHGGSATTNTSGIATVGAGLGQTAGSNTLTATSAGLTVHL